MATKTNINIPQQEDDDFQFIKIVNRVLLNLLKQQAPAEAYVIRINKWFDEKWLNFSGIGRVKFDSPFIDVALDEFRQDQTTFPPFTPNRVLDEYHFFRVGQKDYFESIPDKFVHRSKPTRSSRNLHKRVVDFSESGIFIWFNSQTVTSGRGSLMVYQVADGQVSTWFASFVKDGDWELKQVKGTNLEQVAAWAAQ